MYSKEQKEKLRKQLFLFAWGFIITYIVTVLLNSVSIVLIIGSLINAFSTNIKFWTIVFVVTLIVRIFLKKFAKPFKETIDEFQEKIK